MAHSGRKVGLCRWFTYWTIFLPTAGGIEPPPLVVEDGGLMLPFNPSPGHLLQSVDTLPQAGVEHLLKVMDKSNVS